MMKTFFVPFPVVIPRLAENGKDIIGVHVIVRWLWFSWFYYWQFVADGEA